MKAPCMKNGVCTKRFPKAYRDETHETEDGYIELARPKDGHVFMKNGVPFTNAHVVAFCAWLSVVLNCHINTEVVRNIMRPGYLFKFVHFILILQLNTLFRYLGKGPDSALVSAVGKDDERMVDEIKVQNALRIGNSSMKRVELP